MFEIQKPIRIRVEDDGRAVIIDAQGWHIATMEDMNDESSAEGSRKAKMLCDAFNG